jgi:hypothetical protein
MVKAHYAELFKRAAPVAKPAASIVPWPEVEERPLAVYEELVTPEPFLAAGGVR